MVPGEEPRRSRWGGGEGRKGGPDELLAKNRKGGGWQRYASAKFRNWRRGQSGPSLKALGEELIQVNRAVGIGARTTREEMRLEER